MEIIGIIAEYNPFHNGHIHHIKSIKEKYKDSIIILVLNGYFLERGEVSIINKKDKTKIALNNDIDIILELPFIFGSQSADTFAYNSIKILNNFGVNKIIFGSESNNIDLLTKIADIQLNDKEYHNKIKEYLDEGINYPTALSKALNISEEFNNPNDLLGISYIKAIKQINNNIIPETIQRTNDYHDTNSCDLIISASNIRNKIKNKEDISIYLPKESEYSIKVPNTYFNYLKYKIITSHDLSAYLTVDEGIENRLISAINKVNNIEELIDAVKTKRYTYNKINRMLIHILVGLTKEDNKIATLDYIKVLGFNDIGKNYLNSIKKDLNIPITINRDSIIYKYELKAALIYDSLTNQNNYEFEISNKPIQKAD